MSSPNFTPINFLHLLRLVEAERAYALGDFRTAAYAYDVAQREAATRQRPWHRALIFERSARFYLSLNMQYAGHALLAVARREYLAWGAHAKVDQLDWAYPALRSGREHASSPDHEPDVLGATTTSTSIDLLGILAASQALSSATSIEGLRAQVVDVLSAMTGATLVHLLVRNHDEQTWLLSMPDEAPDTTLTIEEAGRRGLVPTSVVRYAERTLKPLVINDAAKDERFARDPYLVSLDCCSMLVVPILSQGVPQALLLLENRLIRAAFSAERLDSVMLVAGQLTVSLDNARVYASLERKVTERTAELAEANERLETLSVTDALSGVANRRRLEDVLADEWQRAVRTSTPLSIAMIDIDHFKLYNDHYGHLAGDECLQHIANELRQHIRSGDLIARYGGEEFVVVMPNTSTATAVVAAERLRTAVAALREPHQVVADQVVTVSVGVAATVPAPPSTPTELIEAADIELYKAKRRGRNQVSSIAP